MNKDIIKKINYKKLIVKKLLFIIIFKYNKLIWVHKIIITKILIFKLI